MIAVLALACLAAARAQPPDAGAVTPAPGRSALRQASPEFILEALALA